MKKQKRVLISRPDRIGDVVLSTPIPREIKKTFPGSYVAVLLRSYTKDIYLHNPYVDEIIVADEIIYGDLKIFFKKVKEIRKYKFTHALMLLPNERINYLLFLAGIRKRIGTGHKFYQFITGVKGVSRKKYIPLRHEADYCMDLTRAIGVESDNLKTEIFLSQEERKQVESEKEKWRRGESEKGRNGEGENGRKLIGIHSTSGNSSPNWTPSKYKELVLQLSRNKDYKIFVTDNSIPNELQNIRGIEYPNVGCSLRESILNFAALDLLVSASTGPMHICAALEVKTLSLFCPLTACSPELWGPQGNEHKIILPGENYCSIKCPGDPKKCTFEGEGGIGVEQVTKSIKEFV